MITPRARSATRAGRDNKARVYRLLGGAEARRYRQQKKIDFEYDATAWTSLLRHSDKLQSRYESAIENDPRARF